MTGRLLLLTLGAGLVLGALLAGRLGARAPGPARVGRAPRAALLLAGLLCLAAALILLLGHGSNATSDPVSVAITDQLSSDQVSEEARVFLDGRDIGVLKVDQQSPNARIAATVANTGPHAYRLDTKRQQKGQTPIELRSKGIVMIDGKGTLTVFSDRRGRTFLEAP